MPKSIAIEFYKDHTYSILEEEHLTTTINLVK